VVQVEVREQDVETLHALEQFRTLDQSTDAGAGVDHDRSVAAAP